MHVRRLEPGGEPADTRRLRVRGRLQHGAVAATETLNLSTNVSQADVVFSIDTTGSMGNAITNLRSSLSTVAGAVQMKVKSVAMGVVDFKDFGDTYVVKYDYRNTTVGTARASPACRARSTA